MHVIVIRNGSFPEQEGDVSYECKYTFISQKEDQSPVSFVITLQEDGWVCRNYCIEWIWKEICKRQEETCTWYINNKRVCIKSRLTQQKEITSKPVPHGEACSNSLRRSTLVTRQNKIMYKIMYISSLSWPLLWQPNPQV